MKTFVVAVAVFAALVGESLGAECSGAGATCSRQSTGEELCECSYGQSCRPWISTTGSAGNGRCQLNACLGEGTVCSGFVGICCPGFDCVADDTGVRTCTLKARPDRFKVCALGQKCAANNHSSFNKCTGCPAGSSCRTWVKDNGLYGHGYCQLDECIPENGDCTGRKGYCCAGFNCQISGNTGTCVANGDEVPDYVYESGEESAGLEEY